MHQESVHQSSMTLTSVQEALSGSKWKQVMVEEYNAIINNQTWILVPHKQELKVIDCKWVFKVKYNLDGSVSILKARLLEKGFHQTPRIGFTEAYSPIVKPQTIRIVLSIAITNGWDIKQVNINNTFLNRNTEEDVYITQLEGFKDPSKPYSVVNWTRLYMGLNKNLGLGSNEWK